MIVSMVLSIAEFFITDYLLVTSATTAKVRCHEARYTICRIP